MIEIRKTTQNEKAKHNNMAYVIDLGHTKQWFTEKALVELFDKLHKVVNENGLLPHVSGSFYSLIDRLQRHSEWKYPDRMWTIDAYYGIAFQWIGKEKELEERVLKLENDMKLAGAL